MSMEGDYDAIGPMPTGGMPSGKVIVGAQDCNAAIEARAHARQLDSEIAALRNRVAVLEAFVASIQKLFGTQE